MNQRDREQYEQERHEKAIETVRKSAVELQAHAACQILQAVSNAIEHKKLELGYPGQMTIRREHEENASGLLDSMMACLADSPPVDVRRSICLADDAECIDLQDMEQLIDLVGSDCFLIFGEGKQNGKEE
jgi:hypothetical protein